MAHTAKVTRIAPGIYDVLVGSARYELEQYPDGSWLTFAQAQGETAAREFLQDYCTKREAVAGLVALG